ncbi:hypothetical protein JMJ35_004033 [Cladonia borealis]|uniref:Uncharacterized protein n=1 Tax=Cladonia borealis TaxID=184061 RepID=A0AA39R4I3_9LECA|nr:hypothetical protein JMJ35_004033 [Cladonia borealis]
MAGEKTQITDERKFQAKAAGWGTSVEELTYRIDAANNVVQQPQRQLEPPPPSPSSRISTTIARTCAPYATSAVELNCWLASMGERSHPSPPEMDRVRGNQSPSANEAGYIDESFIMNNLALRYRIEGPTGSILSLDDVDEFAFPYSNFHGLGWEASTEWKRIIVCGRT